MRDLIYLLFFCLIFRCVWSEADDFVYDTTSFVHEKTNVYTTAFGDFNGDKRCDIFAISQNAQSVDLFMANVDLTYERIERMISVEGDKVITSIMLADFDGDVMMDVLITVRGIKNKLDPVETIIYWGNQTNLIGTYTFSDKMIDEPLLFEYNGDMLTDLLAETTTSNRVVWIANHTRSFNKINFPNVSDTITPFSVPNSNAFVDVNGDLTPDLVLTTVDGFEVWLNVYGIFQHNLTYGFPQVAGYNGLSSFVDMDQDNQIEHVMPRCAKADCSTESEVWLYDYVSRKWRIIYKSPDNLVIGFVDQTNPKGLETHTNFTFPLSLHFGDYNLDGYPDALAIMETKLAGTRLQKVVMMANGPCMDPFCGNRRSLSVFEFIPADLINQLEGVLVATFYDMYEDGKLDVVMVTMNKTKKGLVPQMISMKNNMAEDASFLKVLVLSGLCKSNCPGGRKPYGVNVPGPTSRFSSVRPDGLPQLGSATQLSQSAHFALQTPYVVYGLGQTPNFVNDLSVGMPLADNGILRQREWHTIIPNSQLVIIPFPLDTPSRWSMMLFVTPSHIVYITGVCLLGTCGAVAIIVCILQWREKREDKLEKKQEAQKFHFDAM